MEEEIVHTRDNQVILTTIVEEIMKENRSTEVVAEKDPETREIDQDQEIEAHNTDSADIKEAIQKTEKEEETNGNETA